VHGNEISAYLKRQTLKAKAYFSSTHFKRSFKRFCEGYLGFLSVESERIVKELGGQLEVYFLYSHYDFTKFVDIDICIEDIGKLLFF
jgi:hypothetical protein